MTHREAHAAQRIGWLRAAILGANDGIVSTASLIAGVAAAGAAQSSILVTGIAGLVAGAMSMAAGEYVSVSSPGLTCFTPTSTSRAPKRGRRGSTRMSEARRLGQECGSTCRSRWSRYH